jgi:hypothetical protein
MHILETTTEKKYDEKWTLGDYIHRTEKKSIECNGRVNSIYIPVLGSAIAMQVAPFTRRVRVRIGAARRGDKMTDVAGARLTATVLFIAAIGIADCVVIDIAMSLVQKLSA